MVLLDCKEIKPVSPKGNQPWIFTDRTDAEVEAPILWSPDAKSQLIGKDPDTGKDWRQEEIGVLWIYYWYGGLKVVQYNHMQFCVQDWILLLRAGNGVTDKSCQAYLVWNKSNYGINDKDLASASLFSILEASEQAKAEMTSEAGCWQ